MSFLGDRGRDPLVQRHPHLLSPAAGQPSDGERKLQWIGRFAHGLGLTFFDSSAGRKHRNSKSFRGYGVAGLQLAKKRGRAPSPHNARLAGAGTPGTPP